MLSKTFLKKEISRIRDAFKGHESGYIRGYIDALEWCKNKFNVNTCPLEKAFCTYSGLYCEFHYLCECGSFHIRGSDKRE